MVARVRILIVLAVLAAGMGTASGASAQSDGEVPAGDPPIVDGLLDSALRDLVANAGSSRSTSAGTVLVEAHYNVGSAQARALVEGAGGVITGEVPGWLIEASVPVGNLEALEAEAGIDFLRLPGASSPIFDPPSPEPGPGQAVSGQHVVESNADDWHAAGYDGAGIKVGIIDLFNLPDWNNAVASGDLPAVSGTFCRWSGSSCNVWSVFATVATHGNNVAEIIHDMAPSAELYIASVSTASDFQAAVDWFDSNDVDIISQSQTNRYDGPGDGTGPFGSVVDDAVSKGMAWFNAAGNNSGTTGNGSYWRGTWTDTDNDGWMNFNGGDEDLQFWATFQNGVRWDDWGEAGVTDFNICVYSNPNAVGLRGCSSNSQVGGADPLEVVTNLAYQSSANYLRIQLVDPGAGAGTDTIEFMQNGGGVEASSNPGNAGGPFSDSANAGAMSIGAIDPATGNNIAGYSSWGPTNDFRTKPDMAGQACLTTSLTPCFDGTSSATPVVAGAAALILQSRRTTTPAGVVSYLRNQSTVDRGAAGVDNIYGWGELLLPAPCAIDTHEDNDTQATATSMANGTVLSASVCVGDPDWYSLRVTEGQDISVDLTFDHANGDVDVKLFDPSGQLVGSSTSGSSNESITHTALASGLYAAQVYGFGGAENTYQIDMHRSICPVDDAFEVNNSQATATPLTDGVSVSAIACDIAGPTAYDVDWYSLPVQAGDTVTATAEFIHDGGDLTAILYDPSGLTQLGIGTSTTDNEVVASVAEEDGAYAVLVFGAGNEENEYTMTMSASCVDDALEDNDTRSTATALANGSSQSGVQCPADDDWFSLDVAAGLDVTVDLAFVDAYGDLDVRLFDPSGSEVASATSGTDNESIVHTALSDGTYTARVYGYLGAQNVYDITMSKSICPGDDTMEPNNTQATATPLGSGVTQAAIACDVDWYSIPVVAGETVSADVEFADAAGDLSIALYNPSGSTQVSNSVSTTDNESLSHVATETGDYGLVVFGAGGAQNVYDVTLSTVCTDDGFEENDTRATATPLSNDVAVAGRVCSGDDDWFSIPAVSGQLVTAVVDFVHADGDLDISLVDPAGTEVEFSTSTSDGEAITWTAASSGTYSLVVFGYNGAANDYTVSMKAGAHPRVRPFGAVANPEGDTGSQIADLYLYLEDASGQPYASPTPVTVSWTTLDIPSNPLVAHPGEDFVAASGVATFLPGETITTVPVEVLGDTVDEPPLLYGEWGLWTVSNPSLNAKIDTTTFFGIGLLIIIDDD
ncbi:MAG: pre-peptidase C-terminal domain-containing protein [Acidimicrobiales bacterium]